jgi:hypothetical protein
MRVLLLLTALGLASPVAAATLPSPPAPVSTPPRSAQDVRKEDPKLLPPNQHFDSRRIQVRPGSTKPEGRPGPGVG